MGNTVCVCFQQNNSNPSSSVVKLIFWDGDTKTLNGKHIAGEIMFESPEKLVCHADSFFIGHPIPALAIDDQLMPGQTYFVLPIDMFACNVLTASCLAHLSSSQNKYAAAAAAAPINLGECRPFEYVRGENGRVLIKVVPEFMISTPELKKHYDLLVGSREQIWSPKLETISEHKNNVRFTPRRLIGL
ncbi:DUF4228 domain-containing protein [Citrus sinensis]|nr:DUF4228 domain-containing protein [Citrus sinensis]